MKKFFTENLILKILSVFLAILTWIVVMNVEDPVKTRTIAGIKVEILNEDVITGQNQVYTVTEGQLISVKVSGPRTMVDSLKSTDFTATADFQDISQANSVPINVELTEYANQQKITISEKSNNTMRLSVEALVDQEYPVKVKYLGAMPENYVIGQSNPQITSITVNAPESVHNEIESVCAAVDVTNATEDFDSSSEIRIYTRNGVELAQPDNNVTPSVQTILIQNIVYYTKKVPIICGSVDSDGKNVSVSGISLSQDSVQIMGKKNVLDAVEHIYINSENLKVDGQENQTTKEYTWEELLPEGVYINEDTTGLTITIATEDIIQKSFDMEVKDIGIKNIPDGMDASIENTGSITVTVEGADALVRALDISQIAASVSMQGSSPGITQARVELQLAEGVTQVETTYVNVNLTLKETETLEQSTSTVTTATVTAETTTVMENETTQEETTQISDSREEQ